MKQAVADGAQLQAADAGQQTQAPTADKPKRARRAKPSPAMEQVKQHLAQAGSAQTNGATAPNALEPLTFHIGIAIDSLDLPAAKTRRPHVLSGFAMSYGTNQS